jgi:large subunit ribosomal protein L28
MSKVCDICGKGPVAGRSITRRGMAKKKGGVGRKIVRTSQRRFLPNIQKMKVVIEGSKKTLRVCTQCLRSGKVTKAA